MLSKIEKARSKEIIQIKIFYNNIFVLHTQS